MNEYEKLTFEKLPEAVLHLMQDVADIKNHLLNNSAGSKTEPITTPEKEYLSVGDVAKKLGVTKGAIYNMTHTKQIPCFKKVGRVYFDSKEIDEWIRSDRRKTVKQLQEEANIKLQR